MAATAIQDEDLIIFNDEVEEDTSNGIKGNSSKNDSSSTKVEKTVDENVITFDSEDVSVEEPIEIISGTEELITLEEKNDPIIDIQDEPLETPELNLEIDPTPPSDEDLKAELLNIQDKADGVGFEDMGIDLDKISSTQGERSEGTETIDLNLESLSDLTSEGTETIEIDEKPMTTEDFGISLDLESDLTTDTPEADTTSNDMDNNLSSIEDFASGFADSGIDEGTHNGILEAAVLKLVTRESTINEDIKMKDEKKSGKKDEIAELKKQIKGLESEVTDIDTGIAELNNEKKTINKTKEGIEKMKIDEIK